MHLCCVKMSSAKYGSMTRPLYLGVLLLLGIFLLIPVLEAFHSPHYEVTVKTAYSKEGSVHSHAKACPICQFFANQQSKQINGVTPLKWTPYSGHGQILIPANSPISLKRLFLSWTNKGPPAFLNI